MFEVGDRVEISTGDHLNGEFGEVVEVNEVEARVLPDRDYRPLWFLFSELKKVEG